MLRGLTNFVRRAVPYSLLVAITIQGHSIELFSIAAQNEFLDISNNQHELHPIPENFFLSSSMKCMSMSFLVIGLTKGRYL